MVTRIQMAHFYRKEYGDAGYDAVPVLADEIDDVEKTLSDALLSKFTKPRPRQKPPHTVDLVDEDRTVILRLYAVDKHKVMKAIL